MEKTLIDVSRHQKFLFDPGYQLYVDYMKNDYKLKNDRYIGKG